jgi:hypothetical protein
VPIGTITDSERATVRARSPVGAKYDHPVNRESAAELLAARRAATPQPAPAQKGAPAAPPAGGGFGDKVKDILFGTSRRQGALEGMAKQAMRTAGSQLTNQILRGVLGGILGSSRRR